MSIHYSYYIDAYKINGDGKVKNVHRLLHKDEGLILFKDLRDIARRIKIKRGELWEVILRKKDGEFLRYTILGFDVESEFIKGVNDGYLKTWHLSLRDNCYYPN